MGVNPDQYRNARAMLPPQIRVVELSNNDAWMRDCGATFVVNDEGIVRAVDWIFNAWGGLQKRMYYPWDKDELVAAKMLEIESLDRYKAPLVMEGGSIHVDGQGTLITTEQCLLHPNRNPDLSRGDIEEHLANYLNIERIILAASRRLCGRDGRPCRQPLLLRASGRCRLDLDRRPIRSPIRAFR